MRGETLESRHRVHAIVMNADGEILGSAGDSTYLTVWRSCAKPFQLFSFVESGGFDACGWASEELALACASHGGEPEHVALASRMLASMGLEEGDLACGAHEPLTRRGVRMMHQAGLSPSRLHNNCSGKHAGMLAFARGQSWSTLGYERLGHEVQDRALAQIAKWSGSPRDDMQLMVDGCGVVAVGLPLGALALAFARLGAAAARGEEVPARIISAIAAHPFLFGGTDRFDTVLIEETGGRLISKVGAEGVHAVTIPAEGIAVAIKVEDGASRAQHPALLKLLQLLGVLEDELSPRLAAFAHTPIMNTRNELVGEVRVAH
ncbi:MAG TPA: asparaginase [Gemmatimonadaceae bacterium]|jgi:L-asparaginase II|nr:asparaginase [Gemmatimonadaceae bacterium]